MKLLRSAKSAARGGQLRLVMLLLLLPALRFISSARAADAIDSARIGQIASMLSASPAGFGWPITNRAAWERLGRLPAFSRCVARGEALLNRPLPELPDSLYLDYSRTGNRDRWQKVAFERRGRIATLTLAECLEDRGRFVKLLESVSAALCAERTWVLPAHDPGLDNFNGRETVPDLGAVSVAMELAEADYVLGDRLSPETRRLIRDNVRRRVLAPFKAMVEGKQRAAFWLRARHNWNAVCLGCITVADLALEDERDDRAACIAAAEHYIRYYLEGFTRDGYCSEGVGYWNYGFGHYILLAEAVRRATGGKVDLMADPAAAAPALFGVRSEILNGIYPTISDVRPGTKPDAHLIAYLGRRFSLNATAGPGLSLAGIDGGLAMTLMLSSLEEPLPATRRAVAGESPLRTWFPDAGVLICRTGPGVEPAFAAVLKGGNNGENHNHNDVGSFSVVSGRAMVICDPGMEIYTARTFGPHRYDSKVLNSFGHAVPVVADQLQSTGSPARAEVRKVEFSESADTFVLDLRAAYAVPGLLQLDRTYVFRRGPAPSLEVRDAVRFERPGAFESALVTWGDWTRSGADTLEIRDGPDGVRVRIDAGGRDFQARAETLDADVPTPRRPVRLGIRLAAPVTEAVVKLTIEPLLK